MIKLQIPVRYSPSFDVCYFYTIIYYSDSASRDLPPPPPDVQRTPPDPDYPSGILSIIIHQVSTHCPCSFQEAQMQFMLR